jgi:hypothetical protein
MKLLNIKISPILKLVLLFSLFIGGSNASVVSSDRFIFKILDKTVSFQDLNFQLRNLQALSCIYDDSYIVQFFEKKFVTSLNEFVKNFPSEDEEVRRYLHSHEDLLKQIRQFFKMLRYSEDQKTDVSSNLKNLIRESARENKCNTDVLYKNTLKTNFIALMEMELYLRSRYGGQLKDNTRFDAIKSSIELFVESLDKQFSHEYYW